MSRLSFLLLCAVAGAGVAVQGACGGTAFTSVGDGGGAGGSGSGSGSGGEGGSGGGSGSSSGSGSGGGSGSSSGSDSGSSGSSSGSGSGGGGADASVPDAGQPFACGPAKTCDGTSQYCQITEGGPVLPDSGSTSYLCEAIPAKCATTHTCACISGATGNCSESNGDVTVTRLVP